MRARVWLTTYRRPDLLRRCLASIAGIKRQVVVVHPADESHELPAGFKVMTTPPRLTGIGVVGPRWLACEAAMADRDEVVLFLEDDVIVRGGPAALELLLEDLEQLPNLAVVQWRGAFPPLRMLSERVTEFWSFNGCFAVRLKHYSEAGGFDVRLRRMEEIDLSLRLRVLGHDMGRDLQMHVHHKSYEAGGLAVVEGGEDLREAAARVRRECSPAVMSKWPDGVLKMDRRGWLSFRKGKLAEMQELHRAGRLKVSLDRVQVL